MEQIATARTNSHGQAQIATACGGPLAGLLVHALLTVYLAGVMYRFNIFVYACYVTYTLQM